MKILQVVSSSRTSGAEKHALLLSEQLQRRGHDVLAVCPPGEWLPGRFAAAGVPVLEMPMRGASSLAGILHLRRIAREQRVDLIHAHLTRAAYFGYFAGYLARVPMVSTIHVRNRDFLYRLPGRNHSFIAVSDHIRNGLIDCGLDPQRVVTVYNGTEFIADESHATDLSVHAEFGLPAGAELVGLFGRVRPEKGHSVLVEAAKEIVAQRPRAYFLFVGHAEPAYHQELWELAERNGVADRLRFTGVRNDVERLMSAVDVTTLPSLTEACSMVIIESMAMGKPVVATRAGGNPELIQDQATGVLVERTPEALASALVPLLANPLRREAMGRAGKARAHTLFSAQAMTENLERVYTHILGRAA